jgi:hypothetical protein
MRQHTTLEILTMQPADFARCFGFRPVDALDLAWFAARGARPSQAQRDLLRRGRIAADDVLALVSSLELTCFDGWGKDA